MLAQHPAPLEDQQEATQVHSLMKPAVGQDPVATLMLQILW
jgi:hypothetical protein